MSNNNLNYFQYLLTRTKRGLFFREKILYPKVVKRFKGKVLDFGCGIGDMLKFYECSSGVDINDVKKVFIHQANEKMDDAILKRFYRQFKMKMPENIMPMTIGNLGNSSVATVPTLLDVVRHNKLENHSLNTGDVIIFASVGAGMHINAIVYKY